MTGGGKGEKWEERKKGKISSSTLWHASSVLSSHYISLMGAQQCVCVCLRANACVRERVRMMSLSVRVTCRETVCLCVKEIGTKWASGGTDPSHFSLVRQRNWALHWSMATGRVLNTENVTHTYTNSGERQLQKLSLWPYSHTHTKCIKTEVS